MDLNNRMDYYACSPTEKEARKHDGLVSIQWMKDKIGRINAWAVCSSKFNADDKSVMIERLTGNRDKSGTSEEHFSYEDICKIFWWKSFEVVGADTLKPDRMTLDERLEIEKSRISATPKEAVVLDADDMMPEDETEQEDDFGESAGNDEDVQDE